MDNSSPLDQLKSRVFSKKGGGGKRTSLTDIIDVVRELGCLGEAIGKEYEVRDAEGKLVFTIEQKPMKISQMIILMDEIGLLRREDDKKEAEKWGGKGPRKRLG